MSWLALMCAFFVGVATVLAGATTAGWFTLLAMVPYGLAALALKRGASGRFGFWVTCLTTFVLFVAAQASQIGLDEALVAWCALFPITTTLFAGPRLGLVGLCLGLVCAALIYAVTERLADHK